MTREELNKKKVLLSLNNKKYEKVAHSGTENFLAYRKKVLEGRAKMDALKRQSEMFNVTEANDKHYNDLVNTGMLIHAQSPMYGEQRQDVKYYKREGEPGKYRYYYTKEEYDAAHKNNTASSQAEREAQARQQYETNKKIETYKQNQQQEKIEQAKVENETRNADAQEVKKYADIARNGSPESAAKEILNSGSNWNQIKKDLEDGIKSGEVIIKDNRVSYKNADSDIAKRIEDNAKVLELLVRDVDKSAGSSNAVFNSINSMMVDEANKINDSIKSNEAADELWKKQQEEAKERVKQRENAGNIAKNKAAAENSEADRWAKQKQQREADELWKKQQEEAKERVKQREADELWKKQQEEAKERVKQREASKEYKEEVTGKAEKQKNDTTQADLNKASKEYKEEVTGKTDKKSTSSADVDLNKASKEYKEEVTGKTEKKSTSSADVDWNNVSDEYKKAMGMKVDKPSKSPVNDSFKETQDKIIDDAMKDGATAKDLASKYNVSKEYIEELVYNVTGKSLKEEKKTPQSTASNALDAFKDYITGDDKKKKNGSMNHSAIDQLTPEQEYLNFKAKVESGMKKQETIRHSMFIKSGKKVDKLKDIKPLYDTNKFDFYENVKKFKEEHQNSLSHYGTKGQKWGTRHWQNIDGTFNEAGKERYFGKSSGTKGSSSEVKESSKIKSKEEVEKEFQNSVRTFGADKNPFTDKDTIKKAKKLEKSFYNGKLINHDKIEEWLNSEENQAMVNKYNELFDGIYGEKSKKINDLFKDYDADEDKYVAKAGICDAVMHGDKLSDIGWEISWMLNDDGDQGSRDSHSYYLQEKGYSKKDINDLYNDQEKAYEAAGAIANLTTKYNPVIYNMSDNIRTTINNELAYNYNKTHGYVHAKISGAADGMELDKNNISAANDIANKLSPSCGGVKSNGWYYVNRAINNLPDLKDKSYKELTQADWDKINAEINSIKK